MSVLYFHIVFHHVAIFSHLSRGWSRCSRDHNALDVINSKAMSLPVHATLVTMLRKGTFKTLKTNLIDHELLPTPRHIKTLEKLIKIVDIKYF